jgi:ribonuclease P protein component
MALLRVALAPNAEQRARVGFVVPRRAGDAVTRNRVRRRLRALVQSRLGELSGLDVVVRADAGAAAARWAALSDEFNTCLTRARRRLAAGPPASR